MEDLSIKNLHMHFSGVRALDGVSFTVKNGEIFSQKQIDNYTSVKAHAWTKSKHAV